MQVRQHREKNGCPDVEVILGALVRFNIDKTEYDETTKKFLEEEQQDSSNATFSMCSNDGEMKGIGIHKPRHNITES